jgi:hypothetical protein
MQHRTLPLALFAAPFLLVLSASSQEAVTPPAEAAIEVKKQKKMEAHSFGPISYFNDKCGRCHGENGAQYVAGGLEKMDNTRLKQWIDEMAHGPGQSPLDAQQLEIETRWMRTLATKEPFAHLQSVQDGEKVIFSGEALPEVKVSLQVGEQVLEAKRDGITWKIEAPKGTSIESAQLIAEK